VHHVLNWAWQGALIALATGLALRLLDRTRAHTRYTLCWCALVLVLVLPFLATRGEAPATSATDDRWKPASIPLAIPSHWSMSTTVLLWLWAGWGIASAARLNAELASIRRITRHAVAFPAAVEAKLEHWTRARGRGRSVELVLTDQVRCAAVLGCGRPVIAVAPSLVATLSRDALDRVILHEWAHVQRRDDLLNVAHVLVRGIAGWHPAVWWLERQLRREREAACDESAVAITGCAKHYASSLAAAASLAPISVTQPILGAFSEPQLHTRVVRILAQPRLVSPARSLGLTSAAVLAIGAVAVVVSALPAIEMARSASTTGERQLASAAPPDVAFVAVASDDVSRVASAFRRKETAAHQRPAEAERHVGDPAARSEAGSHTADRNTSVDVAIDTANVIAGLSSTLSPRAEYEAAALVPLPTDMSTPRLTLSTPPALSASSSVRDVFTPSPWRIAADAGIAVGRGSERAATASAGFFTRFGRKVAGSF
jgi:beta-lactamase regulating signal transducer with metallopeptidase domain